MTKTLKLSPDKAVAIRHRFTDCLQWSGYTKGVQYARMTQKMKKWSNLESTEKWQNDWRTIARHELKACIAYNKVPEFLKGKKFVAGIVCFMACKF